MMKYQVTEDMAQYPKCWMTKIMAGPAQGDDKKCEKLRRLPYIVLSRVS